MALAAEYLHRDQADELENATSDITDADALKDWSLLLADARDRIEWLLRRAEKLKDGGNAAAASALGAKIATLLQEWSGRELGDRADIDRRLKALETATTPLKKKLVEITSAAELAERVKNPEAGEFAQLSPEERAVLWSRGVSQDATRLDIKSAAIIKNSKGWDHPRTTLRELAEGKGDSKLSFAQVLTERRDLTAARSKMEAPSAHSHLAKTFDVSDGLLTVALGCGPGDGGRWAALADEFKARDAWVWEALARILQAAAGSDRENALNIAWKRIEEMQTVAAAAPVDSSPVVKWLAAWHARVASPTSGAAGGGDSLTSFADQRASRRQSKAGIAAQFLTAANADEKFRLMQQAKGEEVGARINAVATVEKLKQLCQSEPGIPRIHLFLEMLEVNGKYFGLAVGSKGGAVKIANQAFFAEFIDAPDSNALLSKALSLVNGGNLTQPAMIIIAPDGDARLGTWAGDAKLSDLMRDDKAFFFYVPSAAALEKNGGWTAEAALRYWHDAAADPATFVSLGRVKAVLSELGELKSYWMTRSTLMLIGFSVKLEDFANDSMEKIIAKKRQKSATGLRVIGFSK